MGVLGVVRRCHQQYVSPSLARFLRSRTPLPRAVQHLAAVADLRGHRFFAGAIAQGDWPGLGRVVFRLMGGRYGDARDWPDIDAWAHAIARELESATPGD